MGISSSVRSVVTVLGFAAVTAAAGLGVAWPHTTYADGEQPVAEYTPEGTKIGGVVIKGELVRDTKSKTGWVVVVVAKNKSDDAQTVALETDLVRTVANPMARVAPMPQTVWNQTETLTVAAHQQVTKRFDVPAAVATQVTQAKTTDASQAKRPPQMRARTAYAVQVRQPGAPQAQMPGRPRPAMAASAQPTPAQPTHAQMPTQALPMQQMQAPAPAPNAPAMPIGMQTF